ncbi:MULTISPECIES: FecCD family ABC transporter permease [Psychroflexus]|uniref:Iron complex transport system permease protein n=1 Tax=Psychroflexus halocasei TaxID=908615 RepID=A0A1H3YVK1_9FLAO|nr:MULTISPECIES: iron ABC transporter permease [Psychroflexus]PJX24430.1 iron ABC transporter [Psychroflexus sp. S27]SEA15589.1 iron complex transport system permease protein [Psychroflexus halocasei]
MQLKSSLLIVLLLTLLCLISLSLGSVSIPLSEVFKSITFQEVENQNWHYIIVDYRLPKTITAIFVGGGLALSGLLMQTLFRNPLAGPYVLGLSSGASLGVAILILGSGILGLNFGDFLSERWLIVLASSLGSLLVMFGILMTASRIKDTMALLIIGLMFASLTGAVVNVLSFFSSANELQKYVFWSLGSLGDLTWNEVSILAICSLISYLIILFILKNLNSLLLGEKYAESLGVNLKRNRFLIILSTSLLAGSITAFAGPIAFIGLAVPHLTRQIIKTNNHLVLVPSVLLSGAILMLICDIIAQLPFSELTIPINAVTSIIGAPLVIWLLVKQRHIKF